MGLERCLIIRGKTKTTIIMCEIKIFEKEEFGNIGVVEIDNEPWFLAKEITNILGYSNQSDAIKDNVDYEECKVLEYKAFRSQLPSLWSGKDFSNKVLINESGLYSLIMSSKLPNAKKFRKWVTSEVLPSIRKNGGYISNQSQLTPEQIMANALVVAQKIIEEQNNQMLQMTQKMSVLEKKSDYLDIILQSKKTVAISQIAQDYGFSAKAFNKILKELHIQHKINGQWILYASYLGEGYVHSKTVSITRSDGTPDTVMNTEWTQKGRIFLYNTLKGNGHLPLIEQ